MFLQTPFICDEALYRTKKNKNKADEHCPGSTKKNTEETSGF